MKAVVRYSGIFVRVNGNAQGFNVEIQNRLNLHEQTRFKKQAVETQKTATI